MKTILLDHNIKITLDYTNYTDQSNCIGYKNAYKLYKLYNYINRSENKNCLIIIKIIQTIVIAHNIIIAFDYTNYADHTNILEHTNYY